MAGTNSPGYPGVIAARNPATEKPDDLGMDPESRTLNVNQWVWNAGTLRWEKLQNTAYARVEDFLEQLLIEMKKMNKYLSVLSGTEIQDEEIE